jgi:hypothetical protein
MNANNQLANIPANISRHQQEGRRNKRTSHFSSTEVQGLLNVIEEILPVHGEEWEDVSQSHAANFPSSHHTNDSLKRKFQQLSQVKKLTGDLFFPPEVRKAKHLHHVITTKCEIDDAKGGPLPPGISFDKNVVVKNEDDKIGVKWHTERNSPSIGDSSCLW